MIPFTPGPVDYVVNGHDRKRYCISTVLNAAGFHETAITTPVSFWKRVPKVFAAVTLFTTAQTNLVSYPELLEIGEEKHCLLVRVTELTERDITATHAIVEDVVCNARKEEWLRKIVQALVPYLKSVGTFDESVSQEPFINDFAERHTLANRAAPPR